MRIRAEQMDVFNKHFQQQFKNNVSTYLATILPDARANYTDDEFKAFVERNIAIAKSFGVITQKDVADYLSIALEHGEDFYQQQNFRWAESILRDSKMAGGTKLLQLLTQLEKNN